MPIDNASWHYGAANFPPGRAKENGGNHTGYFLTWIVMNDLEGQEHREDKSSARFCNDIRARKRTGRDFLFAVGDEKFTEEDLSPEGLAFTEHYYDDAYNDDYFAVFGTDEQHMYEVDWTWPNYDKLAKVMDGRFAAWKVKLSTTKTTAPAKGKVKPKKKAAPAKGRAKRARPTKQAKPTKPTKQAKRR